jgi:hypothetical protein
MTEAPYVRACQKIREIPISPDSRKQKVQGKVKQRVIATSWANGYAQCQGA